MKRRVFIIEAGKAFPVVAGALYLIDCGGNSTTSPSAVADISSTSTVVNAHSHSVGVPASDQLHPATTAYTSSTGDLAFETGSTFQALFAGATAGLFSQLNVTEWVYTRLRAQTTMIKLGLGPPSGPAGVVI